MAHRTTNAPASQELSSHWSTHVADPNAPTALERRARELAAAWNEPVKDRTAFIAQRVRGRRALDIGCVAHDEERMKSPAWLHQHVANAASECLGVDVLESGVDAMVDAGYAAVVADLSKAPDALVGEGLFQVIVAGELIEHVGHLDMLFDAADRYLTADGELIITTPNPYAPARVRAGRRGEIWENVDHIMYAFPSGIAELASRHGLLLAEARTTDRDLAVRTRPLTWLKRTLRRCTYHRRGFATTVGVVRPITMDRRDRLDRLIDHVMERLSSRHRFTGETAIYVVRRRTLP